ncbi:MAG TPA: glycosyltransferase WbuB, partial [Firmicutes bacterium]|nr:glycosyltransferase WbuB [Bacillota bacterium]
FSFGKLREKSLIGRLLVRGEYWIYRNANALIFTKEGDVDYIKERKWDTDQGGAIDLRKCHYINNGVDLKSFDKCVTELPLGDPDLQP